MLGKPEFFGTSFQKQLSVCCSLGVPGKGEDRKLQIGSDPKEVGVFAVKNSSILLRGSDKPMQANGVDLLEILVHG